MKKICILLLSLLLLVNTCALAEVDLSEYSITDANVAAVSHTDITAPFSGTLACFDWEAGDSVAEGDLLFSFLTETLYAPEDGKLTALYVTEGELSSFAMQSYGCLGSIEPTIKQRMNCTTEGANDDEDNEVWVGEMLYFKSSKGDKPEGEGRVISRSGKSFVLEITTTDETFDVDEKMTLYRSDDRKDKENVGKGTVARRDPLTLNGTGLVCAVYAQEGQELTKGEKILSMISADAQPGMKPELLSPCGGVIASVAVNPGQQVWKGELLCRLYHTETLEIVAQVDEMDLHSLKAGDTVYYTLDTEPDIVRDGKVTEISSLGISRNNAAYYAVHVSIEDNEKCRLGQSASLYLPKD